MHSRSSGSAVELKKPQWILSNYFLYIALWLVPFISFSQNKKTTTWEAEKDYLKYQKEQGYDGPDDWYGSYPAEMERDDEYYDYGSNGNSGSGQGYRGATYSPQQIQRDRQERYQGIDRGGGGNGLQYDPEVQRPDPLELPDIDAPDVDVPDIDLDLDLPNVAGSGIWKILLFILIAVVVLLLAYLIFKNSKPINKKVIVDVEDDWNPEVISKTELELRLEAAMAEENYRECVRIYFTFILKELIRKSWINWKKDKTNHSYLLEMNKRSNYYVFAECIRIYDLVWYGEYEIDRNVFEMLRPTLENYYQSLEPANE